MCKDHAGSLSGNAPHKAEAKESEGFFDLFLRHNDIYMPRARQGSTSAADDTKFWKKMP